MKQVHSLTLVDDDDDDDNEEDDDGDDCAIFRLRESIHLDVKDMNSFEFHQLSLSWDLFPFAEYYIHKSTITII